MEELKSVPYDATPEERAYISQLLEEFRPYMLPETEAAVAVHKIYVQGNEEFNVTLMLKTGEARVQSAAANLNLFDAISMAKEDLMDKLISIQQTIFSELENQPKKVAH